jgi:hypothetical protein
MKFIPDLSDKRLETSFEERCDEDDNYVKLSVVDTA